MHRAASAVLASLLAACGAAAQSDTVRIEGGFDCGPADEPGTFFQLRGQSVYFSNRTSSLTTGGQLDGIDCRDNELAQFDISFLEFFPEESLSDYLTFGYFGIVDTIAAIDTDGDGIVDTEEVIDTSFVMAIEDTLGEGATVEDYFPSLDEATIVTALTTTFDSPEFFDALFTAVGHPDLTGDIALLQVNAGFASPVRPGQQLTLVAFKAGVNGDEGMAIGSIATTISRIPDRYCADQNNDGVVTPADFNGWIANFNANSLRADTNGDGAVTAADFNAWIIQYDLGSNGQKCLN